MAKINNINNACSSLAIDPGASGDSQVQLSINGIPEFVIGVDDDASDVFKISQGGALGTTDCLVIDSTGNVTTPLNCCFSAYSAGASNVTGDGTSYKIQFDGGEYFDLNSDFSTDTFTAPKTGKYFLTAHVQMTQVDSSPIHQYGQCIIVTTGQNNVNFFHPWNMADGNTTITFYVGGVFGMTAGDTASIKLYITNTGSTGDKIVDIVSGANTVFSGFLIS